MVAAPSYWMIPHWDLSVGILLHIQTPDCAVRRFLFSACTEFNHHMHVGMQIRLSSNVCKEFGGEKNSHYVCIGVCSFLAAEWPCHDL